MEDSSISSETESLRQQFTTYLYGKECVEDSLSKLMLEGKRSMWPPKELKKMKKSFKIINKYNTKFLNSRSSMSSSDSMHSFLYKIIKNPPEPVFDNSDFVDYIGSDLSQEPNRIFEEINSNPLENLEDDDLKARINAILKKTRTSNKHKMKSKSAKR